MLLAAADRREASTFVIHRVAAETICTEFAGSAGNVGITSFINVRLMSEDSVSR
jgi:hypothetical protein